MCTEYFEILFDYIPNLSIRMEAAKKCALLAVSKIQNNHPHQIIERFYVDSGGNETDERYYDKCSNDFIWIDVKKEIENL